jgi:hypothetical protein
MSAQSERKEVASGTLEFQQSSAAAQGWWQCGRQRGREEAAAARARARGRRRTMALAPGESGRYRLAFARAGAPARTRGGREGGEALAGRERGRERRDAI